jgi:hypothetical protein
VDVQGLFCSPQHSKFFFILGEKGVLMNTLEVFVTEVIIEDVVTKAKMEIGHYGPQPKESDIHIIFVASSPKKNVLSVLMGAYTKWHKSCPNRVFRLVQDCRFTNKDNIIAVETV